jgi:hypothetical protein
MARRLISSRKKLRGVPRRLRALRTWANTFKGYFPAKSELHPADHYWNLKLPVDLNLVESRWTTDEIRTACAQALVDAAEHLFSAKPEWASGYRVTASVTVDSLFSSEVCIYLDEAYFLSHASPNESNEALAGRSLSQAWGVQLPPAFGEVGLRTYNESDEGEKIPKESWWWGEVQAMPNNSFKPKPLRGSA